MRQAKAGKDRRGQAKADRDKQRQPKGPDVDKSKQRQAKIAGEHWRWGEA